MPVEIRPLEALDRADWTRLWSAYLTFYETTVSPDVFDTTFARLIGDDPQDYRGLVACVNDTTVGLAHFLFHRHCWRVENVCYLQDLYIDETYRGQGAGQALIEAVYREADAAGSASVYWTTQHFNENARRLYDRVAELTPFIKYQRVMA